MEKALEIKQQVFADTFYQCQKKKDISAATKEQNRISVIYSILKKLGHAIQTKKVDELLSMLSSMYLDDWFPYPQAKKQSIADDCLTISRFVDYVKDECVIESNIHILAETSRNRVDSRVNFITSKNGIYYAYILRFKKADKSPNGKSVHSCSETDLSVMAAKLFLEHSYPGIVIRLVYLVNDGDSFGSISNFTVLNSRKSNMFSHNFKSYYDETGFCFEVLQNKMDSVISTPVEKKCFVCEYKDLCSQASVANMPKAKSKDLEPVKKTYSIPVFTDSQKKVINKTNGKMLVCAGPGSGKTATLIGRIKKLIEDGVPPEFILAITFSKDAAMELKERCLSFCKSYELPEIMTLNALGYQILKLNPEYVGTLTLMTQRCRYSLIDSLLEITEPLNGFNYLDKEDSSLIVSVDRALKKISSGCNEYGQDLLDFYDLFNEAIKEHGYITYDEQITRCLELFERHPDVLDKISSRYQYIMVDEFQDINSSQAEFIYSLSKKHGNICCVGDDDQSIYAFRGGSNKYMLEFKEHYPNAEIFSLKENFRTSEEIYDKALEKIAGNQRIEKEIVPVKKGGIKPIHIKGQSSKYIDDVISVLNSKGVSNKDIAVIASQNSTLETLQKNVSFDSVLGKEYLIKNPFFQTVYWSLYFHYKDQHPQSLLHLSHLIDETSLTKILEINTSALAIHYCENIAEILSLADSAALTALTTVIGKEQTTNCHELFTLMDFMVKFGDETRVEPNIEDEVIFITAHESKGMEWKVVLMIDDYRKDKQSEEQNRLTYVAMTRAEDILYIFDKEPEIKEV